MCGRYTLKTPPDQWGQLLLPIVESTNVPDGFKADWKPRYNIAPTQNILAVKSGPDGERILDYFRWGLVPSWAKELSIGNRMINARGETVDEKKSFAKPLEKRRCMVLADGYYEWKKNDDGSKQPCWIAPQDGSTMCLAGLWESNNRAAEYPVQSCTIITTAANSALNSIHDRMPVMLDGEAAKAWMNPDCGAEEAKALLGCPDDEYFRVRYVSPLVNNPRNESEDCIQEI